MPLPTTEKTAAQSRWYTALPGYTLGTRRGWWGRHDPAIKAQEGSGAAVGKNAYSNAYPYGLPGAGGRIDCPVPAGTLETYRAMLEDDAIKLARASLFMSILAAETYVEIDDDLKDDATAQFGKTVLEREIIARRSALMADSLRCLDFGWQSFENVYEAKKAPDGKPYTGIRKCKPLLPENVAGALQIDAKGNFLGIDFGDVKLRGPSVMHLCHDREGDDWYGNGLLNACRRPWQNKKNIQDRKADGARLGTGVGGLLLIPSDTKEDADAAAASGTLPPNLTAGKTAADRLKDGEVVVAPNLMGLDPRAIENNADLAGKSTISFQRIDMGNPGPLLSALGSEEDREDKRLVRCYLQPERTLVEATMAGSRADSESHADLSIAVAEAKHEFIVGEWNAQLATPLIVENCGERYVGRIRLVASPLQDEQKAQLVATWAALIANPQFASAFVYALGEDGVQDLLNRIGSGLKLAKPFDMLPEPSPEAADAAGDSEPKPREPDTDDDN